MQKSIDRSLFTATTLIVVVATLLGMMVIPDVMNDTSPHARPEMAIPAIQVFLVVHLLVAASLVWMIIMHVRGGKMNRTMLLITGIVLITLSLLLSDGAFTYLDHPDLWHT